MNGHVNSRLGRVGELLAAAALERLGCQVVLSPTQGYDLVAFWSANPVRVQVKAARQAGALNSLKFQTRCGTDILNKSHCDAVALVSLDSRHALFFTHAAFSQTTHRFHPSVFNPEREAESWRDTISRLHPQPETAPCLGVNG